MGELAFLLDASSNARFLSDSWHARACSLATRYNRINLKTIKLFLQNKLAPVWKAGGPFSMRARALRA